MYTRIFASLWDGSIMEEAVETRWLFLTMLTIADADRTGVVDMPIQALARRAAMTEEQVRAALEALKAPDPRSSSPDEDGRRIIPMPRPAPFTERGWIIVNWEKYRNIINAEVRREQVRTAVRKHRGQPLKPEVKPPVTPVTPRNKSNAPEVKSSVIKSNTSEAEAEAEADAAPDAEAKSNRREGGEKGGPPSPPSSSVLRERGPLPSGVSLSVNLRGRGTPEIPTLEEVQDFAAKNRPTYTSPERFFDYWEERDWKGPKTGKPISDWRRRFLDWNQKDKESAEKEARLGDIEENIFGSLIQQKLVTPPSAAPDDPDSEAAIQERIKQSREKSRVGDFAALRERINKSRA